MEPHHVADAGEDAAGAIAQQAQLGRHQMFRRCMDQQDAEAVIADNQNYDESDAKFGQGVVVSYEGNPSELIVQINFSLHQHDSWKHFVDLAYWNVELDSRLSFAETPCSILRCAIERNSAPRSPRLVTVTVGSVNSELRNPPLRARCPRRAMSRRSRPRSSICSGSPRPSPRTRCA